MVKKKLKKSYSDSKFYNSYNTEKRPKNDTLKFS